MDTHERLRAEDTPSPGSDRSFGLLMGAVFALLAGINGWHAGHWWPWFVLIAALFLGAALVRPVLLAPLNQLWFRFGLALHAVVNPVVMGLIFYGAVTPTAWIMRARGNDLLRVKREPDAESYWIKRQPPGPAPDTMKDQF